MGTPGVSTLLKTLFAPAFPCLTGLLGAPRWERLARVLLVSQRWLAVDVLLDVFSLVIVHTDHQPGPLLKYLQTEIIPAADSSNVSFGPVPESTSLTKCF